MSVVQAFQVSDQSKTTPTSNGALSRALSAGYSCAAFNCAVRAEHRVDVIAGDYVDLVFAFPGASARYELVRMPAGGNVRTDPSGNVFSEPTGSMSGNRLLARKPGLYVVELRIDGGFTRTIECVAWPVEAVRAVGFVESQSTQRRMRIRQITRDPRVTRETITVALEGEHAPATHPVFGTGFNTARFALFVGSKSISLSDYGA